MTLASWPRLSRDEDLPELVLALLENIRDDIRHHPEKYPRLPGRPPSGRPVSPTAPPPLEDR